MHLPRKYIIVLVAVLGVAAAFLIFAARRAGVPCPAEGQTGSACTQASPAPSAGSYVEVRGARISVDVASTEAAQEQGLSGRDSLALDHGMLFVFPAAGSYGFWMKDMKFPIDIVWVSSGTVVGWEADVDPQIGAPDGDLTVYYPPQAVDSVIELPAGKAAALDLAVGDPVIEHIE